MEKVRHYLSVLDLSRKETDELLKFALELKRKSKLNLFQPLLYNRILAMIFEKPSTRTRISFEVAMRELGGHALYLSPKDLQLGRGETICDTARVMSRYVDAIMARVFSHNTLEELAKCATIPVINGLSDLEHPCQILADLMTIIENKGKLQGIKLAFLGDGSNNVSNSLLLAASMFDMEYRVGAPKGFQPSEDIVEKAKALNPDFKLVVTEDPYEAARGADVIYTDVWTSMGQEGEKESREKVFPPYQVNSKLLEVAKDDAIVLHCLPAHRGQEITDEVIDGPHSRVWDQAENRLHAQKALLVFLLDRL